MAVAKGALDDQKAGSERRARYSGLPDSAIPYDPGLSLFVSLVLSERRGDLLPVGRAFSRGA